MTALVDFGKFPPEFTSARLRCGSGSVALRAAAVAWQGLAHELSCHAHVYGSVITGLVTDEWHGAASVSMAVAAGPYRKWMAATAAQAEQTAAQANAAAAAYDDVLAQTVPPSVIAANRARRNSLIATNFLGQNSPAIAAVEAQYTEMWARDAAAMYSYASSSAAATDLTAFRWVAPDSRAVATTGAEHTMLAHLMSNLPQALRELASPVASASSAARPLRIDDLLSGSGWLQKFWTNWGPDANVWNTIFSSGFYMPSNTLAPFLGLLAGTAAADNAADAAADAASGVGGVLAGPSDSLASMGRSVGIAGSVWAGLGSSASIGPLSVPPAWTAVSPTNGQLASMSVATPMTTPPPAESGIPGMPLGGMLGGTSGQGPGRPLPQYGFRPTVVARPPAGG